MRKSPNGVGVRVAERDLAAAPGRVGGGGEAEAGAALLDQGHQQLRLPQRLGADVRHRRPQREVDPDLQRRHRQHRRHAHRRRRDPRPGAERRVEAERLRVAEPAGDRAPSTWRPAGLQDEVEPGRRAG